MVDALLRRRRAGAGASTPRPTSRIQKTVADAAAAADAAIERFAIHEAIAAIWTIVDALNRYITEQEPWVLAKDDGERASGLGTVLVHGGRGPARARRAALAR